MEYQIYVVNTQDEENGIWVKFPFDLAEVMSFLGLSPADTDVLIKDYHLPFELSSNGYRMLLRLEAYGKSIKEIEGSVLAENFMAVAKAFFGGSPSELLRKQRFIHHYHLSTYESLAKAYCLFEKQIDQDFLQFVQLDQVVAYLKEKYQLLMTSNGLFHLEVMPFYLGTHKN